MIKIKDEKGDVIPGIVRDPRTHGVANIDYVQYQKYKIDQKRALDNKADINNLKNEMTEIKTMLTALMGKLNAN
jgi:hypothetical protein